MCVCCLQMIQYFLWWQSGILEPVVVYRGIASVDNYCTLPIAQSFNYQYRKVKIYEEGKENVVIFNYQYGGGGIVRKVYS